MNNSDGHLRLRRGLLEHLNDGKMRLDMLGIYTYLLLKADYNCGIIWHISAPYITLKLRTKLRHVQRQLAKLEKEGYIKRFGHRGNIAAYDILINKYLVHNGVLIDSDNTTNIKELAWTTELKGNIVGTYCELKRNLSVVYLSPYKEIKNIRIEEDSTNYIENTDVYKKFNHLSMTNSEFEKLNKEYSKDKIDGIIESIQNYSKNKKYTSLYLTTKKWLAKEYGEQNEPRKTTPGIPASEYMRKIHAE